MPQVLIQDLLTFRQMSKQKQVLTEIKRVHTHTQTKKIL